MSKRKFSDLSLEPNVSPKPLLMPVPPSLTEGTTYPNGSDPRFHMPEDPVSPELRDKYYYTEKPTPYADDYVPISNKDKVQAIVDQNRQYYPTEASRADRCRRGDSGSCSISGGRSKRKNRRNRKNKSRRSRR
jgi:hypothetical protein